MNGVVETMDYLMGRNPINQNYVSGYGEKPMKYPHHLYFCPQVNPSFPSVPPGFLSSGPNSGLQDPWASSGIIEGTPAMECYLDHVESWSTNQVSSNLNASLAWLTAYLDGLSRKESPTPVPTSVPDIKSLDVSGDGVINMMDIVMVAGVFNSTKGDTRYVDRYDFNSDNVINMADIMMLAAKFNTFILVY
jgi:endoglucanase